MPGRDDYDDDPPRRRNAPLPGGVRAAGIIWISIGALGLATAVLSLVGNLAMQGGGGPGGPVPILCSFVCFAAIPAVFLMVGVQTVKGTAKGTLGNGIGSIIFGLLALSVPVSVGWIIGRAAAGGGLPGGGGLDTLMLIVFGVYVVLGLALFVAGGLAIAGRDAYTEWRVARGLARGPRRTAEQEDYEDRPRRRPRDDDDR
jgi:hypothetical protein